MLTVNPVPSLRPMSSLGKPAVRSVDLDDPTFHGLGRSPATHWTAEGVDARTVQHLLCHADPRLILKLYAHSNDQALATAAESVNHSYCQLTSGALLY